MPIDSRPAGLVLVFTGDGKGKTSAALGTLFRAWGRQLNVCMLQFIKHTTAHCGEHRAARRIGVPLQPMGDGFTWLSRDLDATRELARRQWDVVLERLQEPDLDLLILDEITYPVNYGWISVDELLRALKQRRPPLHVVLTGREAPPELVAFADLVTEMKEIKHPFRSGNKARPGIDF